jgi:hypothetical protein
LCSTPWIEAHQPLPAFFHAALTPVDCFYNAAISAGFVISLAKDVSTVLVTFMSVGRFNHNFSRRNRLKSWFILIFASAEVVPNSSGHNG